MHLAREIAVAISTVVRPSEPMADEVLLEAAATAYRQRAAGLRA
jgi:hypothetical protein